MLQVAVVGSGITGLSVVHHLQARGLTRVALFNSGLSVTEQSPGVVLGGVSDLFTRVSHARGFATAKAVWQFGNLAQDALLSALAGAEIPVARNDHIRIGQSSAEAKELDIACQQLTREHFDCTQDFLPNSWQRSMQSFSCLREIGSSANFDLTRVLDFFRIEGKCLNESVLSVTASANSAALLLVSGQRIDAEFVVLANHLGAAKVYPRSDQWLVSYGDQWSLIEAKGICAKAVGATVTWNFGYDRLTFINDHQVALAGGRTLRKGAAIGVEKIDFRPDICDRLVAEFKKILPEIVLGVHKTDRALLECRPCDELPIIGPIPGEERILIGTGFMGQGLSLGYFGGKCLADFICDGRAPDLPEILMPRRLRSLSES